MDSNKYIEEYLLYYVSKELPPNYAVLIRGSWGSGKSFFIKNFIEKDVIRRYLYVSLYGISSFDDIETAFFKQLNPRFATEGMQFTGALLKGIFKSTLKLDLNLFGDSKSDGSISTVLPDIKIFESFRKSTDNVLVFDDLERCSIPILDIMGYINQLVENDNLKAIIIANEEKLVKNNNTFNKDDSKNNLDTNNNEYSLIKEKLIGKTFSIAVDIDSAIYQFTSNIQNSYVNSMVRDNIVTIKNLFDTAKYNNLRHLKQAFLDFERFISLMPKDSFNKKDLIKRVIEVFFSLAFELKKGIFKEKNIIDIFSIFTYMQSADPSYTQEVSKKYGVFGRHFNPVDPQLWYDFFVNGMIDKKLLASSIHNSVYYELENTPSWKKLKNIWNLELSTFEVLYKEVYGNLIQGNVNDKYVLLHIVDMFLFFSKENIIKNSQEEIYDLAINAINSMQIKGVLNHEIGNILTVDRSLGSEYFDIENVKFKEVYAFLKEKIEFTRNYTYKEAAKQLLTILERSVDDFEGALLINNFGASRFYEIPILLYINKNDFLDLFFKLSPLEQRHIGSVFAKRYTYEDFNEKIQGELEWLQEIQSLVNKENERSDDLLKKYLINKGFLSYMDVAIKSLIVH